mgnify:FL=1
MQKLISSRRCIALCASATITATLFFPVAVFAEVSPESSKIQGEAITSRAGELKTNTLLDDSTTIDLHNDNTILRDVKVKKEDGTGQVSFGPISIWLGANISYDVYNIKAHLINR